MIFSRKKKPKKIGGLAFFFSFTILAFLAFYNFFLLPALWDNFAYNSLIRFSVGIILGVWAGQYLIRGHHSVFAHETKHAVVSGLAGNRAKGMNIQKHSGHFEYSYTKDTEEYNAFIALAPYILPLLTIPGAIITMIFWHSDHFIASLLIGVFYGADLIMNIRDIGDHQTDLTQIRGGYGVGLAYVVVANVTIFTIIAAWVMQQGYGLRFLLYGLWQFVMHLVAYYRG